jgi:GNAT superfamily N-acetyltransferase
VVTAESYKRKGVATRLVAAAEQWGRTRGATVALCDTYVGSRQSIPFWQERTAYQPRSVRLRKRL